MFGTLQISSILDKNERIEETIPLRATRWQAWVKSKFDTGSASTAQLVELAEAFPFAQSRRVYSLRAVRTSRTSVDPSLEICQRYQQARPCVHLREVRRAHSLGQIL